MTRLREWLARLWSTVRPRRLDADIEEELRLHLELASEADRQRLDSGTATGLAAIRLGTVAQTMETVRDQRGLPWLDDLSRDLRHGLRSLHRNPLFASIAIVTLGLAIGINTAIFSVIETVMLRTLPVQNPNEVYFVGHGSLERPGLGSNYPYYERVRTLTDVFAGVTAYTRNAFKVSIGGVTEITQGQYVSGNYHTVLGIPIVRGRGFSSDDRLGADALIAVISDGYWARRFGRSPDVIGRTIVIDGRPVAIVGVTAPGFEGLEPGTPLDITLPLAVKTLDASGFLTMHDTWTSMPILARVQPGVTESQAALALEPVFQQYFSEPENAWLTQGPRSAAFRSSLLLPAARGTGGVRAQYSTPLGVLTAMVGIVLLIACANLANLLLARGAVRAKEVAVRLSIGASRARLVRQYLTESLLLSLLGGTVGLALAWAGARTIVALVDIGPNPVHLDVQLNTIVLAFTAAISILTGLLFGLAPALRTTRVELTRSLKEVGTTIAPRRLWSLRQLLVTAQIALCLTLVSSATLLTRTLQNLETQDGGFDRQDLLMFSLDAHGTAFPAAQMPRFCADLIERLVGRYGLATGSCSTSVPIDSRGNARALDVPGAPTMDLDARLVFMNRVTPDYFRTLRIGVVGGRVFDTRDTASSGKVAVINRATARAFFGNANPIGRIVHFYKDDDNPITVVGVVEDARQYSLRQDPLNTFYTPLSQVAEPESLVTVALRSRGDASPVAAALRSEVRALDTDIVVHYVRTMDQQIDVTLVRERLLAILSTAFGLLALTLACVGVYGVVSYDMARRTREIGIRLALGARRADLLGRLLRGALSMSSIGVLAGLLLALAATGLLSSQLFGIAPRDPLTLGSAAAVIVATTLMASYLPARRASRLDPARVLRSE